MSDSEPDVEAVYGKLKSIGISSPYASQLARGLRRPSLSMAIRIFHDAGLKLGILAEATDTEIAVLARFQEMAA